MPHSIHIPEWIHRAQQDYYILFVQTWIPFNAWYKREIAPLSGDRDRNCINYICQNANTYKNKILSLLNGMDRQSRLFKQELADLHSALLAHSIPDTAEPITFRTTSIYDLSTPILEGDFYSYHYKVERTGTSPNFQYDIRIEDKNTHVTKYTNHFNRWKLDDLTLDANFIALSDTVKTHAIELFKGVYRGTHIHQGIASLLMKSGMRGYNDTEMVLIFDHYFRNLYTILRFIDESKVFDEDSLREEGESVHDAKYKYATILRASLSGYELVMLYYNGLSDVGKSKLKPLLEKYCMLNNLNKYLLTMCLETRTEIGVSDKVKDMRKTFQDNDYSGTDYELLLTDNAGDDKMYHYTAFAHTEKEKSDFLRLLSERQQKIEQIKNSLKYKSDEEQKYERVIGGFSMN